MSIQETIDRHRDAGAQISRGQAFVIASVLAAHGRAAEFLVFGCGNDSALWDELNEGGRTLFVENDREWLEKSRESHPGLETAAIEYPGTTVATSLPVDEERLAELPVPEILTDRSWDLILVDSPKGHRPEHPGRSASIYWAARVAGPRTHVFVDDYHRDLEREHADRFLRAERLFNVEVPRVVRKSGKRSDGRMLWSLGLE